MLALLGSATCFIRQDRRQEAKKVLLTAFDIALRWRTMIQRGKQDTASLTLFDCAKKLRSALVLEADEFEQIKRLLQIKPQRTDKKHLDELSEFTRRLCDFFPAPDAKGPLDLETPQFGSAKLVS